MSSSKRGRNDLAYLYQVQEEARSRLRPQSRADSEAIQHIGRATCAGSVVRYLTCRYSELSGDDPVKITPQVSNRNRNWRWRESEYIFLAKTCTLITYKISIGYQTRQPEMPIGSYFMDFVSYLYPFQPTAC
jgi:hypothetical protein